MFSRLTAPLDRLRSLGLNAPVIHIPDLKYQFYVATDASAYGIGGVIYQVINDEIKYNAFAARSLSPTERRYHTSVLIISH